MAHRVKELESLLQEKTESVTLLKQESTKQRASMASISSELSQMNVKLQGLKSELAERDKEGTLSQKREKASVDRCKELESAIKDLRSKLGDEVMSRKKLEFQLKNATDDNDALLSQLESTGQVT